MKDSHPMIPLLNAPVNLTWEIASACNLSCRHCLSEDLRNNGPQELDFRQCTALIDELAALNVFQINFGGGEPFLREDFLAILEYAHGKGIVTCVSTNGTVFDHALADKLKRMDLLYVQVSLDGATAETNDRIRGKGSYKRILRGIELLASCKFGRFSINMVVTSQNFPEIPLLDKLAREYGARTRLSRFRPAGGGKESWDLFHLRRDQLRELSIFLSRHADILTADSFFAIASRDRRHLGLNMCGAARMTCSVSPDGSVYPCPFLQDGVFYGGNVTLEPLASIWRESRAFHTIRNIHIRSCESCSRFDVCHGGCPAVAYFLTRSLHHPDPECMATFHNDLSKENLMTGRPV
jgi:mycofactocin radical SAM maturase